MILLSFENYPVLEKYLTPLPDLNRPLIGREKEVQKFTYTLFNSVMSNPCLLGEAGTGKTALVQGVKKVLSPHGFQFFELDLLRMQNDIRPLDSLIKDVIDQLKQHYRQTKEKDIVFVDEMHLLFKVSEGSAAQAMKQVLADSARYGLYFAFATTLSEYEQYVAEDEAFDQRMLRISLPEVSKATTMSILQDMVRLNLKNIPKGTKLESRLFEKIVDYTDRYLQGDSQPRKSIKVLDSMIGRVRGARYFNLKYNLDTDNLAEVLKSSIGVDIKWDYDLKTVEKELNAKVIYQTLAIKAVINRLYIARAHLNDPTRPLASFLYSGPTGVGKTELAKAIASVVFGSEKNIVRFDMTEYSVPDSVERLRKELTKKIWATPNCVLLFDEIEKASPQATKLLLPVLDDARLTNRYGKTVSFADCIIVMTTNVAHNVYKGIGENIGDTQNLTDQQLEDLLNDTTNLILRNLEGDEVFPTELINRIDVIAPFAPLIAPAREKIALMALRKLRQRVFDTKRVKVDFDKKVLEYIVYENSSNDTSRSNGRTINHRIDSEIVSEIAKFIYNFPNAKQINVGVSGNLIYKQKTTTIKVARIKVGLPENILVSEGI